MLFVVPRYPEIASTSCPASSRTTTPLRFHSCRRCRLLPHRASCDTDAGRTISSDTMIRPHRSHVYSRSFFRSSKFLRRHAVVASAACLAFDGNDGRSPSGSSHKPRDRVWQYARQASRSWRSSSSSVALETSAGRTPSRSGSFRAGNPVGLLRLCPCDLASNCSISFSSLVIVSVAVSISRQASLPVRSYGELFLIFSAVPSVREYVCRIRARERLLHS
jgi:hypothetical protein